MSELFCTKCSKLHESQSEFCEYCGYDLKVAIQRFKEREELVKIKNTEDSSSDEVKEKDATGMEFYEQIKEGEKRRKKYEAKKRSEGCSSSGSGDYSGCVDCIGCIDGCNVSLGLGFLVSFTYLLFHRNSCKKLTSFSHNFFKECRDSIF